MSPRGPPRNAYLSMTGKKIWKERARPDCAQSISKVQSNCGLICCLMVWRFRRGSLEGFMELGMVGLGRMGANMVERLVLGGHKVVGYDRDAGAVERVVSAGAMGASSLEQVAGKL